MLKKTLFVLIIFTLILSSSAQAYPIIISDNFGSEVIIEEPPQRIVSLSPCNTEILFAVGAGDQVVGGTTYDTYPLEAVNLSKIGGFSTVDIEAVVNLTPDLVLAEYGNGEETVNALKNLNLTVVSLNPKTLDDILDNILLVGNITGNDETSLLLTTDMEQKIENIGAQTKDIPDSNKPAVLYIVWHDPMYAAGTGSYPNDLMTIAGGMNIVDEEGWPIIDLEQIIDRNPEIIICSGMGGGSYTIMEAITENEVLSTVDAIKNNKVYPISDPNVMELAGPRIVEGLTELYGYIEPEIESNTTVAATEDQTNVSQSPDFSILFAISIVLLMAYLQKRSI
ncbi:MAG: cobalamin-binding protein [Methanosarcinales archaeon]|nr:cobalamin-binding protein [Methanosarcinales archaeon]